MTATPRCVHERYEVRGNSSRIVCYELYSDVRQLEGAGATAPLRVFFKLPVGAHGTALSERPPRCWELSIEAASHGVDYRGTFLVPVYARHMI